MGVYKTDHIRERKNVYGSVMYCKKCDEIIQFAETNERWTALTASDVTVSKAFFICILLQSRYSLRRVHRI